MNQCGKIIIAIAVATFLQLGISSVTDVAWSAIAPEASNLEPIIEGVSTPVRLVVDKLNGDIYATDERGGGVLRYNRFGKLLNILTAVPAGAGIAIDATGSYLLVANGTSVAVLVKSTGVLVTQFGFFTQAHDIALDGAGQIYVTDSLANNVQVFSASFTPLYTFGSKGKLAGQFLRPTAIAYEKVSGLLAVADSLNGRIQFLSTTGAPQYSIPPDVGAVTKTAAGIAAGPGRFTAVKGVAFEYDATGTVLNRIYASDAFQSSIQVFGSNRALLVPAVATGAWTQTGTFKSIGEYGYENGKLVTPLDIKFDNFDPLNPRLIVSNSNGFLTMYGCDSMEPSQIAVLHPTQGGQLVLNWVNPPATSGFHHIRIYRSPVAGSIGTLIADNLTGVAFPAVSSYTDSGLPSLTTYYYTVHAVNGTGAETNGTKQVSEMTMGNYALNVTINPIGTGTGDVNSNLAFTCSTGICSTSVSDSTVVTLIPNPNASSVFAGWTGACTQASGNCVITMKSTVNVTATFNSQHPFWAYDAVGSPIKDFDVLQDAYSSTPNSIFTIRALYGTLPAATTALLATDAGKTVVIDGGYSSNYTTFSGTTTIQGAVKLQQGKTIFKNIKIK